MRIAAMVFLLLAAHTAPAQQLPEVEPNDTAASAQPVPPGQQVDADLMAGEADWFSFSTGGGHVRLTTSGLDTRITLFDAQGQQPLGTNDDSRSLYSSDLSINLVAGSYTLEVVGYLPATAGPYSLDVGLAGPPKPYSGVEAEPNDTAALSQLVASGAQIRASLGAPIAVLSDVDRGGSTATLVQATAALVPSAYGGGAFFVRYTSGANAGLERQVTGNSATALTTLAFPTAGAAGDAFDVVQADVDVYRVVLTAPRTGVWFLLTEGEAPFLSQHRYEFWDAAGALLAPIATLGASVGATSLVNCRMSQFRVWPAGTYHVAIRRLPTLLTAHHQIPYGSYRFEFVAMPMDTHGAVAEVEPNDGFSTATPIAPGQQGTGSLSTSAGPDASDWWGPIAIGSPSVLMFQTGQGPAPAIEDTTILLRPYDPVANTVGAPTALLAGNLLDPTSHARGAFVFPVTPMLFYLEVVSPGANPNQAGNYVLEIGELATAPYCPASYATGTSNTACGAPPFPTFVRQFQNEMPTLGQSFVRTVTGLPPHGLALLLQGFSDQVANGATPLPFDLTPLGAPGCTLDVDPAALSFHVADGNGTLTLVATLPADAAMRGLQIHEQVAALRPSVNPLGLQMSNQGHLLLGDRSW